MNRTLSLAFLALAGAGSVVAGLFGVANPPVELQPATPGVAQAGNANITGKLIAGSINATNGASNAQAVVGDATSTTGSTFGGLFRTSSPSGTGVRGVSLSTASGNGGTFQSAGTIGAGVRGFATGATGENYGVYGQAVSPDGFAGFFNGRFKATGRSFFNGYTTIGPRTTSPPGTVGEVLGLSSNVADWTGMYITTPVGGKPYYGYHNTGHYAYTWLNNSGFLVFNASGDKAVLTPSGFFGVGTTAPVSQVDARNDGIGMGALHAQNGVSSSGFSSTKRALFSEAKGSASIVGGILASAENSTGGSFGTESYARGTGTTNYAVYGFASGASTNYAGYFAGLLYASSASAGVKAFVIDHPLDPENKFLEHSSVESDQRMNLYRGVARTDDRGYAYVPVPSWFDALNADIQYQLTVIDTQDSDSFVLAKVVQKVKNGQFKIRTSEPNVEVNWQISGRRHDPTSEHFPMQVERSKNQHERGRYLEPAAFGKGPEWAIARGSQVLPETVKNPPQSKR